MDTEIRKFFLWVLGLLRHCENKISRKKLIYTKIGRQQKI